MNRFSLYLKSLISDNPLFFIFIIPFITDRVLTLISQDSLYWQDYKTADEGDPIGYILLSTSPLLFIFESFLEIIFWYILVKFIPRPWSIVLALGSMLYSTLEGSSWIGHFVYVHVGMPPLSLAYQQSIEVGSTSDLLYFIVVATIAGVVLNKYFQKKIL